MQRFRLIFLVLGMTSVISLTCVVPTDRSDQLSVRVAAVPTLFLKDSVNLAALVVDQAGAPIPNAVVSYSSSDPTVVSVDTLGVLRAVGVGSATLTATAIAYADAAPFTGDLTVRGLLEIDSIRPASARFGETLSLYGVGLNPDSIFSVTIGGVEGKISSFVPQDTTQPDRLAVLDIWVPPPAGRFSTVTLLGFAGGVVFPDTIAVIQRDLYEPNDTAPAALGDLPFGFRNPALAFEREARETGVTSLDRQPADWYTFNNTATQDRTVIFFSDNVGAQSFGVFITDSLGWVGGPQGYTIGPNSWTIGLETYFCGGMQLRQNGEVVTIDEVLFPISIIALKDLPAGTYHVLAPYFASGTPASYELVIASQYVSVRQPDAAEENDYCDVAAPLPPGGTANLTIDNPHDIDWFKFSVAGLPQTFSATATTSTEDADLDLYLVADFRPDSLVLLDVRAEPGGTETITGLVTPGNYFLIVVDFPGVAAQYNLSTALSAASAADIASLPAARDGLATLREKRAARGAHRPASLKPRGRN